MRLGVGKAKAAEQIGMRLACSGGDGRRRWSHEKSIQEQKARPRARSLALAAGMGGKQCERQLVCQLPIFRLCCYRKRERKRSQHRKGRHRKENRQKRPRTPSTQHAALYKACRSELTKSGGRDHSMHRQSWDKPKQSSPGGLVHMQYLSRATRGWPAAPRARRRQRPYRRSNMARSIDTLIDAWMDSDSFVLDRPRTTPSGASSHVLRECSR
jgi:hypothetical protein